MTQKGEHMRGIRRRALGLLGLIVMLTAACGGGGGGGGGGQGLATDQTLRFPIVDDVEYLDPGKVSSAVDIAFVSNVFSGVVKFDNNLKIVPDLVESLPDISSDGKTYTFKLRKNAKFSNGDPVTSKDVIYSWTRGGGRQGHLDDRPRSQGRPDGGRDALPAGRLLHQRPGPARRRLDRGPEGRP